LGGSCRQGSRKVLHHERHTKDVPLGEREQGIQKVQTRGEDVVRKMVHINNGQHDPPGLAVLRKVQAGVMENFVPLVGKEGCDRSKQPPIALASRVRVVDVPNGGSRAWFRHDA
jgi:hypothetical protein